MGVLVIALDPERFWTVPDEVPPFLRGSGFVGYKAQWLTSCLV